jgi:sulfatase-modifying factor enzyme 1
MELYQVHGNVSEWIGDCWHYDYEGAPLDGTAWTSIDCERPMLRGGNWNSTPWELRSASRGRWASAALFYPLSECGSHGRFDERAAMRLHREIMRRANPSTVLS